ncbi:MAG: hypothetical protein AAF333_14595 [Planctomycetota bacterium]
MSNRRRPRKPRLIEKHGNTIVLNKKWCLRGLAALALGLGLLTLVFPDPVPNLHGGASSVATAVGFLVLAEFAED